MSVTADLDFNSARQRVTWTRRLYANGVCLSSEFAAADRGGGVIGAVALREINSAIYPPPPPLRRDVGGEEGYMLEILHQNSGVVSSGQTWI